RAPAVTAPPGSGNPTRDKPLTFTFVAQMPPDETAANAPISSTASLTADARASDTGNNPNDPTTETFSDAPEVVAVDLRQGVSASAVPDGVQVTLYTDPNGTGATETDTRT